MGLLTLLALSLAIGPQKPPLPKVVVLDVQAQGGVTADLAQVVSGAVVMQVRRQATGLTVIGSDDLRALVGFVKEKRKLGCQDMSCLAEIGGALGADQLVIGTLAKLGKSYLLDLRLIDARHVKVLLEANERLSGENDEMLLDAAERAVATLFGSQSPAASGPSSVSAPIKAEAVASPAAPPGPKPAPAVPISAPAAAVAETAVPPSPSHPRPIAWACGGVAIAAAGLGIVGLAEALSFKGWQSQQPGAVIPTATWQQNVNAANTWGTVAVVSGIVMAAGLTAAALTW